MDRPSSEKLRERKLTASQVKLSWGSLQDDMRQQKERLQRIREVSADYLEALKRILP
jgi:hypothetical protein